MTSPDLIRLTTAAHIVGVNVETLARLVQASDIACGVLRLGSTRYLRVRQFEAWRNAYLSPTPAAVPVPETGNGASPSPEPHPASPDAFAAWRKTFEKATDSGRGAAAR